MTQRKVSIVLPVYNGASNLCYAIDSIINQTYCNIEIIAVNDCSTDGTPEILKKYAEKDSRIVIINNPSNMKLPRSLNIGFENATGDYFTWTSDDNIYKKDAIQKMVEYLQFDKNVDMVYANYTQIDGEGAVIGTVELPDIKMLPFGNVVGACFLYKREIARLVGSYDADAFLAEDYDYWIRAWKVGNIVHLNEYLYLYRRHAGSLTSTKHDMIQMQTYKVLEKHFLFLYSMLNSEEDIVRFFDHILSRARGDESVRRQLCCVNKKYKNYKRRQEIKERFMKSLPIRKLREIKRKVFG